MTTPVHFMVIQGHLWSEVVPFQLDYDERDINLEGWFNYEFIKWRLFYMVGNLSQKNNYAKIYFVWKEKFFPSQIKELQELLNVPACAVAHVNTLDCKTFPSANRILNKHERRFSEFLILIKLLFVHYVDQ